MSEIAKTVVHRHHCDCESASSKLAVDEHAEHRFEINGVEFPWYITERGPLFSRLSDTLYAVDVEILCLSKQDMQDMEVTATGFHGRTLMLDGVDFPWELTSDGYSLTASTKTLLTLRLSFLVESVDTDGYIDDRRPVYNIQGEHVG